MLSELQSETTPTCESQDKTRDIPAVCAWDGAMLSLEGQNSDTGIANHLTYGEIPLAALAALLTMVAHLFVDSFMC